VWARADYFGWDRQGLRQILDAAFDDIGVAAGEKYRPWVTFTTEDSG